MPTYKYEGAYAGGEKVSGVVEAVSKTDAVAKARQSCEIVLSLREVPRASPRDPLVRFHKISAKSLSLACQQFAIILKGGLPLVQTVDLVAEQCADRELAELFRQVSGDVSGGWSLSYSFEQRGASVLPSTFRETVRAGEESGDLLASFDRMADYFERINRTHNSLVSALTYPAFVLAVAVVVIAIIMGYGVPAFTKTFEGLGAELPWVTRALIAVSGFLRKYNLVLLVLMALAFLSVRLYGATEEGGLRLARAQLRVPVVGGIVRMTNASQFAHTMGTLLAAGMPILQAIDASGRAMENRAMAREVLDAIPGVREGRPLGQCLSFAKELPEMLTQMTAAGEAAGSMESMLQVLAEYYDSETDVRVKRALSMIEPIIIVCLSFFVVFILLAVYLPMFSMYSQI